MTALASQSTRVPPADGSVPQVDRRFLLAIFSVCCAAASILYFVTVSDLWLDEALSVNIARLPLGEIPGALRQDGAPPLYYVALHFWTGLFGTSDIAVRSLSAVCMVGAVVAIWCAARRVGGETVAWVAACLTLTNPYAIRFATEARMYSLVMLLVACGILAFQRMLERPSAGRAAAFGAVVALGCYTQYWWWYGVAVIVGLLAFMILRGDHRGAAVQLLVATGLGVLAFLPWVPAFRYQLVHTGTPWGGTVFPFTAAAYTLRDFVSGVNGTLQDRPEGWLLIFVTGPLLLLGAAGRTEDERRIRLDLRLQPETRRLVLTGGLGLGLALTLNYVSGSAWQSRYSCIAFPFFVILIARGITLFRSQAVFFSLLCGVLALSLVGGVQNLMTQRTDAGKVGAVLRLEAQPGDLVVYCPDQLGPSVHRQAPAGLREVTYPAFAEPDLVDWVDYADRLDAADPAAFAKEALVRSGGRTIWFVSNDAYTLFGGVCETIRDAFKAERTLVTRTSPGASTWETPALEQFVPAQGNG